MQQDFAQFGTTYLLQFKIGLKYYFRTGFSEKLYGKNFLRFEVVQILILVYKNTF